MAKPRDHGVIGSLSGKGRARTEIAIRTYRGRERLDVRTWIKKEDGTSIPTPSGEVIEPAQLDELLAILRKARRKLKAAEADAAFRASLKASGGGGAP